MDRRTSPVHMPESLVDQGVPEGTCSQVLRSTSIELWRFESIKIFSVKLIEIVISWVYYTISLALASFGTFGVLFFIFATTLIG